MGHSSIQVTVDLYGHLIPGGNKQAVDRLDSTVQKAVAEVESATPAQLGWSPEPKEIGEGLVNQAVIVKRSGVSGWTIIELFWLRALTLQTLPY